MADMSQLCATELLSVITSEGKQKSRDVGYPVFNRSNK